MGDNNNKDQTVGQDDKIVASTQNEDGRASIKGRPNIDEIRKKNEREEKRDRKSSYTITVIIILLIIIVMLLVYFFS